MKKFLLLSPFIGATMLSACTYDVDANVIRIAILPTEIKGESLTKETFGILKDIGKALPDYKVEYVITNDNNAARTAIVFGQVDMVWTSTATFWSAEAEAPLWKNDVDILATTAPNGDIEQAGYKSIIATHINNAPDFAGATTDAEKIAILKDKSFSFSSKSSTSGGKLPREYFWKNTSKEDYKNKDDIYSSNKFLKNVSITGSHTTSLLNILQKTTYAGAYWDATLDTIEEDKNYKFDRSDLFYITEIQAPGDPLWYSKKKINNTMANNIRNYLTSLTPETASEGVYGEGSNYFTNNSIRWVATDKTNESYKLIRDLDEGMNR